VSSTMYFANLGSTPNGNFLVTGNLYALILAEDLPGFDALEGSLKVLSTAFLFDLRRPRQCRKRSCGKKQHVLLDRTGPPVPSLPEFRFSVDGDSGEFHKSLDVPPAGIFESVNQIYLIDLTGYNFDNAGNVALQELFPNAVGISVVSRGDSGWYPGGDEINRIGVLGTVDAVEETYWTEIAEKLPIEPFDVFIFPAFTKNRSASALVSGEISGHLFSFFFGNPIFKTVLSDNRVKDRQDLPLAPHFLSAGTWRAFYSFEEVKLPPVRKPSRQT
jgi:hypothetical protein